MEKDREKKYKEIAIRSFETKLTMFLFNKAIIVGKLNDIDKSEFNNFIITDDIVLKYTAEYWQKPRDSYLGNLKIDDIYTLIKGFKESHKSDMENLKFEYLNDFERVFNKNQFENLLNTETCEYCGISKSKIELLAKQKKLFKKNERGWSLEIDRKNSNFEYSFKNCVMACYWCNNAKTDEFTVEEFKLVGKAIAQIWEKRLNQSLGDNR